MSDESNALRDGAFMDALFSLALPSDESRKLPAAGGLGLAATVAEGLRCDPLLGPFVEAGAEALREAALAQHPQSIAAPDFNDTFLYIPLRQQALGQLGKL